LKASPFLY